jgi:outer membrane scaffolding protein for murein synthesis (MipA/OmpV family)
MRVMVQAARGVNGVHTGWLGAVSLGYGLPLTTHLHFAARAAVELASDAFVDTYFGVPPDNAASSGLPPTVASGGVLGAGASINVLYAFTPRWAVNGAFGYRRLLGDAASSPVTAAAGSPNQVVAALGVGYLF